MKADRKTTTINTLITSLSLQKNQIESQLYQLKDTIQKKQQTIKTFENYLNEYKQTFYNMPAHRVPSYQNTQKFLDKLTNVLYSENSDLHQLEARKMELLSHRHIINQKIDGFKDMLSLHQQICQTMYDNMEDANRTELAVQRACQQLKKENNE